MSRIFSRTTEDSPLFRPADIALTAALLISSLKIFAYFPVLIFSGVICGGIVGLLAWLILRRLPQEEL